MKRENLNEENLKNETSNVYKSKERDRCKDAKWNRSFARRQFVAKTMMRNPKAKHKTCRATSNKRCTYTRGLFVPEQRIGVRSSLVCTVKIFHIFLLGINPTRNTRWPACSPLKILLTNNPLGCIRSPGSLKGALLLCLCASHACIQRACDRAYRSGENAGRSDEMVSGNVRLLLGIPATRLQSLALVAPLLVPYGIPQVCPGTEISWSDVIARMYAFGR